MKIQRHDEFVSVEVTTKTLFCAAVIVRATDSGDVLAGSELNVTSDKERTKFAATFPEPLAVRVAALLSAAAVEIVTDNTMVQVSSPGQPVLTDVGSEPWPDPVDGAALFTELDTLLRRYIVAADDAITVLVLWIVHTHAFDAAQFSPILTLLSPVPRCGKTTVLQILDALCRKAVQVTNLTVASLFRTIAEFEPTLLLDEADTYLHKNSDLVGLLNAGHSRMGAYVIRNEKQGDTFVPKRFSLWAAKAIAAIGTIAGTLMDRSIVLPMRRKSAHERVERIRGDRLEEFVIVRRKIARWVQDHINDLRAADPDVPKELNSRAADGWRPLLAIADLVGGSWSFIARSAAVRLLGNEADTVSPAIQLLSDLREIFHDMSQPAALPTSALLHALHIRDESIWLETNHGKPLRAEGLATLLKPFGIGPDKIRLPGEKKAFRGYRRASFDIAFSHYLPPIMEHPEQAEHDVPGIPGAPGFDDPVAPGDVTEKDQ